LQSDTDLHATEKLSPSALRKKQLACVKLDDLLARRLRESSGNPDVSPRSPGCPRFAAQTNGDHPATTNHGSTAAEISTQTGAAEVERLDHRHPNSPSKSLKNHEHNRR